MNSHYKSIVLIFVFALFLQADVCYAETVENVNGVQVVITSPPKKRIHCKVYSSTVTATFDNPAVEKEIKDTDAIWNLSDQAEFRENAEIPYTVMVKDNGYRIFYQPNWISKTLSPEWQIYESEKIIKTQYGGEVSIGTNDVYHDDCKRGSFFSTPGQWKMTFTASLSVKDKNDSSITYTSDASNSFEVAIEGTKILVHTFEGAGALTGISGDYIKDALEDTLNKDQRVVWTRHTWTGTGNAVRQICSRYDDCEGYGHYDTVVLVGHSLGGHAAIKCVEDLHDENIQMWDKTKKFCLRASLVFTIDPVKHLTIDLGNETIWGYLRRIKQPLYPAAQGSWKFAKDVYHSDRHINFYQRCDVNSLAYIFKIYGDSVSGADNNNQEVAQDRFDNSGKSHIDIVQTVAGEFAAALQNVPTQQSSPGNQSTHPH